MSEDTLQTDASGSAPAAAAIPAARSGGFLLPMLTLWRREMVRFFRQRNRVVSALVTPLLFWLLLGTGLNRSFVAEGAPGDSVGYLEYFFPGAVVLMLMNTAIFSTITVIEDRREGFMQGVLVAPISRLAIVMGKVLGGASIATVQGLVFLAAWPFVGGGVSWPWMAAALGILFVLALGLTALCLCMAWRMDSTAGFHAVMMIFLMPMWFLSGAVFPLTESTPMWLETIMWCNPLTYGQASFAQALQGGGRAGVPVPLPVALGATAAFTLGIILLAGVLVSRPRKDGTL
jgi:ABC-2 type transport system permease protein